jgi:hypothetical protein
MRAEDDPTSAGMGRGPRTRASRREEQADTAAALAARLHAAEAELAVPDGLWERISDPERPAPARVPAQRTRPVTARRPARTLVVAVAAAAVAFVALGTWWLASPTSGPWAEQKQPAAGPLPHRQTIPLRVHNSERACQRLHILECALRLAKNPYENYAAHGNSAGRVWHGDRVAASCVIVDGRLVRDERGVSSRRWYRVREPDGTDGWLPGVRTRNSTEVPVCAAGERPRKPQR